MLYLVDWFQDGVSKLRFPNLQDEVTVPVLNFGFNRGLTILRQH
jgi:hypothetical protein